MTALGRSAQRHATGTARRRRRGLAVVIAGLAAALGVLGAPGAAVAAVTVNGGSATPQDPGTFQFSTPPYPLADAYAWTCDSVPSADTGTSASCAFSTHGVHTATVTPTLLGAALDTPGSASVIVNRAPAVSIPAHAPVHVGAGFTVTAAASDGDGDGLTYTWKVDGTTQPAATTNSAFITLNSVGTHAVSLTVTDTNPGARSATASININATNTAPSAKLAVTPNPAAVGSTGATVGFDATGSVDPDADALSYVWDFGDDSVPVTTTTVTTTHLYPATGLYSTTVTVRDAHGGQATSKAVVVQVIPSPLTAGFTYAPIAPAVGQAISLTSTSVGPDSPIVTQAWDLDNDGVFDDAQGATAQWTFGAAGSYQVSLKVTNAKGISAAAFQTINVTGPATAQSPASSASGAPQPTSSARRINPFPVVRLRGRLVSGGARVTLFTVKTAKGSKVRVRCKGRGCPYTRRAKTANSSTKAMRWPSLERSLRRGIIIEVLVTKSGRIGKFTRFTIRSGKAPSRLDRCLPVASFKPTKCSALG